MIRLTIHCMKNSQNLSKRSKTTIEDCSNVKPIWHTTQIMTSQKHIAHDVTCRRCGAHVIVVTAAISVEHALVRTVASVVRIKIFPTPVFATAS